LSLVQKFWVGFGLKTDARPTLSLFAAVVAAGGGGPDTEGDEVER